MGVTGLWTVVQPVARPVKLETLAHKRLAVDASIWIYQFLKAVRDKEGNALRNSHVVGFFRRICKLLFFGIKPVFVFDGGAPVLKRQTISKRKARREGRREDATRTAGKLLAVQMHRRAEEEDRKRREERARGANAVVAAAVDNDEGPLPENLNYVDEEALTAAEKTKSRNFKRKDAYHLPDLDVSLSEMGGPNDPRIMSQDELEEYARQFNDGEDINLYDFSKIDFDSMFFVSLPATDRYNILNAARLRSRLRMGYSKEQLDRMFPDRMAFSKFQIERVKERNELTQRLMNINGMNPDAFGAGRIAGERGKEYVLVKNDGVEGGWVLGVVSNKNEGKKEQPIDLDKPLPVPKLSDDESDDDFEDVPVEGLNRLPKRPKPRFEDDDEDVAMQRSLFDDGRRHRKSRQQETAGDEDDGLFIPDTRDSDADEDFEDVAAPADDGDEDEELQRAIQMSMEHESDGEAAAAGEKARTERIRKAKVLEFSARNAASGRSFANYANARAARAAPRPQDADRSVNPELRAAFEAGRKMGHKKKDEEQAPPAPPPSSKPEASEKALAKPSEFSGPLPFESLDLGKSLFSKKKKAEDAKPEGQKKDEEGGFQKEDEKEKPKPLPPWFAGDVDKEGFQQTHIQKPRDKSEAPDDSRYATPSLKRSRTGEVIDLDADDGQADDPISVRDSEDEEMDDDTVMVDSNIKMDDVADKVRAEPPKSDVPEAVPEAVVEAQEEMPDEKPTEPVVASSVKAPEPAVEEPTRAGDAVYSPGEGSFSWEESDYGDQEKKVLADDVDDFEPKSSPEPDFEDVQITQAKNKAVPPEPEFEEVQASAAAKEVPDLEPDMGGPSEVEELPEDEAFEQAPVEEYAFEDDFSDPEDEELLRRLGDEAEEHARFATQLNVDTAIMSARDYENELKQLRNQQKADRRDADEVTNVMIQECQQLLKLFGLPYITAPMEAEAQCAELVNLGLVDGIVTDDSDIFLFGGTRVYKNMFSQAKFVECYLFNDMEREYGLNREKIIQIAHLLGSDYTEGVSGIGPVTALEIITEFGSVAAFQEWWTDVQTGVAPTEAKGFGKRFRKNAAKIFLPQGFPDPRVDQAYLKPEVDGDPSQFQWGVPDLEALRQFLMATIGWSPARTDEILVPVIRDMNKRASEGTQANMTHFFGGVGGRPATVGAGAREAYAPRRRQEGKSSRMENALERLHQQNKRRAAGQGTSDGDGDGDGNGDGDGEGEAAGEDEGSQEDAAPTKKRRRTRAK